MIDIKPPFFNCECPICYENFDTYVELPCKHIFCKKCIVLSLENFQHCPMCRRIFCIPINATFKLATSYNQNQEISPQLSSQSSIIFSDKNIINDKSCLPCFILDYKVPYNSKIKLEIFEPRYIHMINIALNSNLRFCMIQNGDEEEYCDVLEIVSIKPKNYEGTMIYCCKALNVGRGLIHQRKNEDIGLDDNQLAFLDFTYIQDIQQIMVDSMDKLLLDLEEVLGLIIRNCQESSTFAELINLSNQVWKIIIQYVKFASQKDFTSSSMMSLTLLSFLRLPEKTYKKFYYGVSIEDRVKVIKKHINALESMGKLKL